MLPLMIGVMCVVAIGICSIDAAKAYFAPRLYVIDYLRSEVKK